MAKFIKIDKDITNWEWFDDCKTLGFLMWLIMKANTEEKSYRGITVKRGQLLQNQLGLNPYNAKTLLEHLESTGKIAIGKETKYSVITICDYDKYVS